MLSICHLQLEALALKVLGASADWLPAREGVNPFATFAESGLIVFLCFRFALICLCVPVAEELFLRGFLMRATEAENWTKLALVDIGKRGLIIGTVGICLEWIAGCPSARGRVADGIGPSTPAGCCRKAQ